MPAVSKKLVTAAATGSRPRDANGRFTARDVLEQKPENPLMRFVVASATAGAKHCPAVIGVGGRPTLIDRQRMRNNWAKIPRRDQIVTCRRVASYNWFVRGVASLRIPVAIDGFRVVRRSAAKAAPAQGAEALVGAETEGEEAQGYDFASVLEDIGNEDFVATNVVALWRKGQENPPISILDAELVDYHSCGGIERITYRCVADPVMAKDRKHKQLYVDGLGERMYRAMCRGEEITIVKGDDDWDFEVMTGGKRNGAFEVPELVTILDDLDYLELMKVGDWNLAWFRQQVIRFIKKGYAVTVGQGAGLNSVNMTPGERDELGEAFSNLSGSGNIPLNHDVNLGYLTIDPSSFDPAQVKAAIDRLLFWGGIEAVALFGNFSQQNGAAPSLMKNLRARVFALRKRYEKFFRRIFGAEEFKGLNVADMEVQWSIRGLYSVEELMLMVSGTADGTASPQTRRSWMDLNDQEESRRMREAKDRRDDYIPPFEAKQGLLAARDPEAFPGASKTAGQGGGDDNQGGRPPAVPEA